jgi:hypothetical protein
MAEALANGAVQTEPGASSCARGRHCGGGSWFSMMNFVHHVVRKPTEMLFPVSGALNKMPAETWRQYAPLFNVPPLTSRPNCWPRLPRLKAREIR